MTEKVARPAPPRFRPPLYLATAAARPWLSASNNRRGVSLAARTHRPRLYRPGTSLASSPAHSVLQRYQTQPRLSPVSTLRVKTLSETCVKLSTLTLILQRGYEIYLN